MCCKDKRCTDYELMTHHCSAQTYSKSHLSRDEANHSKIRVHMTSKITLFIREVGITYRQTQRNGALNIFVQRRHVLLSLLLNLVNPFVTSRLNCIPSCSNGAIWHDFYNPLRSSFRLCLAFLRDEIALRLL
jgi:hypothetical protein